MAYIKIAGGKTQDLSECASTSGTFSVQSSVVRSGGGGWAFRSNPTTTAVGWGEFQALAATGAAALANVATSYVTVYFRCGTAPSASFDVILQALDTGGSTSKFALTLRSDRKLELQDTAGIVATGTTVLALNTFYKLSVKIPTGAASSYEVKINEVTEFSGTGNFGTSNTGAIRLGDTVSSSDTTVDFYFEDFIWRDDAYESGTYFIVDLVPNAAGTNQAFTIGGTDTGAHWSQVSERPPNTTSMLFSSAASQRETENLESATSKGVTSSIGCVVPWATAKRSGGTNIGAQMVTLSNGTEDLTTTITTTATVVFLSKIFATDPNTSAAWGLTNLDGLQVGLMRPAGGSANPQVNTVGAMVLFSLVVATGTAAITQAGDTLAAAGTVKVQVAAAITQAADTLAATGTVQSRLGSAALTQDSDTLAAAGTVKVQGTAALTQAANSLIGTGTVKVQGASSVSQADNTLTATGAVKAQGIAALTQADDSVAAAATIRVQGAASLTQSGDSLAATGTVLVQGAAAQLAQESDSLAATGTILVQGSATLTQADDTLAAAGTVQGLLIEGSAALTQADDVLSATATITVQGTAAIDQAADSLAAAGVIVVQGAAALTQADDSLAATATVQVQGSAAIVQADDSLAAAGTVQSLSGSAAITQADDTLAATAAVKVSGSAAMTQAGDTLSATMATQRTLIAETGIFALNPFTLHERRRAAKRLIASQR